MDHLESLSLGDWRIATALFQDSEAPRFKDLHIDIEGAGDGALEELVPILERCPDLRRLCAASGPVEGNTIRFHDITCFTCNN